MAVEKPKCNRRVRRSLRKLEEEHERGKRWTREEERTKAGKWKRGGGGIKRKLQRREVLADLSYAKSVLGKVGAKNFRKTEKDTFYAVKAYQ